MQVLAKSTGTVRGTLHSRCIISRVHNMLTASLARREPHGVPLSFDSTLTRAPWKTQARAHTDLRHAQFTYPVPCPRREGTVQILLLQGRFLTRAHRGMPRPAQAVARQGKCLA